jgi:hypothetical protein
MLTYADVCGRMLTYAACNGEGGSQDLWGGEEREAADNYIFYVNFFLFVVAEGRTFGGWSGRRRTAIYSIFLVFFFCSCRRKDLWGVEREAADRYFVLKRRARRALLTSAYVSICQHMSAYVSIRQHTSAYVSIRQHTSVAHCPLASVLECEYTSRQYSYTSIVVP